VKHVSTEIEDSSFVIENKATTFSVRSRRKGKFEIETVNQLHAEIKEIPVPVEIKGSWTVNFVPTNPEKGFNASFDSLKSWTKSNDERIKFFSGTATYHNTFEVSKEMISKDIAVNIDLGNVKDLAEITINGKNVVVLWHYPYVYDISNFIVSGKNSVEITITNTWANRLIGDEQFADDCEWGKSVLFHRVNEFGVKPPVGKPLSVLPEWLIKGTERPSKERTTFSTWNYFTKENPLLESGLMGKVQLFFEQIAEFKK